ncbi:MAG: AAA family ATPase [Fibrobacterales bacterium]
MHDTVSIQGTTIRLSPPLDVKPEWIAQKEPLNQLTACWLKISESDLPLTPRLIGPPGLGKTTLAMAAGTAFNQDIFLMQCSADTRPEDLIITPVLGEEGSISYHASPLLSAAISGGVAILDEGNRMSEKSWASLAGLLDHRRSAESIIAGITINAHPEFRCVVTMNDDSSTFEIPDYIMSRLQPAIEIPFPGREDELQILKYNIPDAKEDILELCVNFLQQAHNLDLPYSIRDGINSIRYTLKLSHNSDRSLQDIFEQAITQILGKEALNLEDLANKRRLIYPNIPEMDMGEFFFGDDDQDLNPDHD